MPRWNEWVDIEKNTGYKSYGVYKMRLADLKDYPVGIPRFLEKDKDGILQIGSSKHTERRRKYFRGAMEGKGYAQSEGKRLNLIKKYTNFMEGTMIAKSNIPLRSWGVKLKLGRRRNDY